jgi:glycosyltransferase involved in cell wall biosynthesis
MVSVVVPCYNQGRFLRQAIGSVRAQQLPDRDTSVEVIVVDDGSTDDTARIARRLGARVLEQRNHGLSAARNAGLAAAQGELVVFLDADDELTPDALITGTAAFRSRRDLACVLRHCLLIDAAGRPLPTQPPTDVRDDVYAELLHRNITWAPGAAMFRRADVRAAGGFPLAVPPAGDFALYLRFARERRLVYHHMPAVRYRQHEGNMSRDPVIMLAATLKVLGGERRLAWPAYRREWIAGRREWCDFYGEQIVDAMRREWRGARRPGTLARAVAALVRYCPRMTARHAGRKLSCIVRGLPAGHLEPSERFSAASSRTRDSGG